MATEQEPYKATITIELTAPTRAEAPAVFAMALEALGIGASEAEGFGHAPGSYYRLKVEENQQGAPLTLEEFLGVPPKA